MKKHGGKENRVREIAYLLWERDGYPDGASDRHWFEAELLYEAEDAGREMNEGEPPGDKEEQKSASTPPKSKGPVAAKKSETLPEVAPPPAKPTAAKSVSAKAPVAPKRKA